MLLDQHVAAGEKNNAQKSDTKSRVLAAAISQFSKVGFAGASVRNIAEEAGVIHGAIKYHFTSKEELWREVVRHLHHQLLESVGDFEAASEEYSPRKAVAVLTRRLIEFNAHFPEWRRIVLFETLHATERLDWLNDNFLSPLLNQALAGTEYYLDQGAYPSGVSPLFVMYTMLASSTYVFLSAQEIERSFGVDVFAEDQIELQVQTVLKLMGLDGEEADPTSQ